MKKEKSLIMLNFKAVRWRKEINYSFDLVDALLFTPHGKDQYYWQVKDRKRKMKRTLVHPSIFGFIY